MFRPGEICRVGSTILIPLGLREVKELSKTTQLVTAEWGEKPKTNKQTKNLFLKTLLNWLLQPPYKAFSYLYV